MLEFDVSAHSMARASVIFALLTDCTTWPTWSPIDSAEIADGEGPEQIGTTRIFRTGRNVSRERIVEWQQDRHLGYVMDDGSLLDYRGDIFLTPTPEGGTDIRWRATFRSRTPHTAWFWKVMLTSFMRRSVRGLAAYAEIEERVI